HQSGEGIVDPPHSNLHVVNYSASVHARMSLRELRRHLYSIAERPIWIPHQRSSRSEYWGFFLSQEKLRSLPEGEYEVYIDSWLEPGHLTYGECLLRGRSLKEVLISCHFGDP